MQTHAHAHALTRVHARGHAHAPAHLPPRFPNCLVYRDSEEFTQCLERAMRTDPKPLTPEQLQALTWEVRDLSDLKMRWGRDGIYM